MMAKHFNSLSELIQVEAGERVSALMGRLSEEAASKTVISILFLSTGQAARNTVTNSWRRRLPLLPFIFFWVNLNKPSLWNGIELWTVLVSFLVSRRINRASSTFGTPLLASPRSVNSKGKKFGLRHIYSEYAEKGGAEKNVYRKQR